MSEFEQAIMNSRMIAPVAKNQSNAPCGEQMPLTGPMTVQGSSAPRSTPTNTGTGSSESTANTFMAQGRPVNPASVDETDFTASLPINPQVPGKDFVSWAVNGYKLGGDIITPGRSDHQLPKDNVPVVPKQRVK